MNKKRKRFIMRSSILSVIAVVLGYVFYTNFITGEEAAVSEGDIAPNFVLQTMDGNEIELKDLRGQGVFLNFWGTYCPPCVDEMPDMDNQYQEFKDRGVEILAVNVGESDLAIERFVDRLGLTYPILKDPNKNVMDRYGIGPLPATYLLDENGEVKQVITGRMSEEDIKAYMEEIEPS
ncbi:Peroxiredoxin [Alteribacillus persepolensis]|uniref:Peroxiredoxin n=1 Tax=Alteribacillus persepolensis TaxID=568899 RepID=A0A1G8GLJ5_9BACI|nr:thiol-disulfide oxidoreductase ResA [Alteribacillus persepolensis]SDH95196.1 Peroxiredoxin [Alteribacillus persepolensis]